MDNQELYQARCVPPPPKLVVERLDPSLPMPQYAREGDSGFDLYASTDPEYQVIHCRVEMQEMVQVPLGVRAHIPEGYEVQIRPRSGYTSDGLVVQFGTIDSGYRGEWIANVLNTTDYRVFKINHGIKLAQAVLAPVTRADIVEGVVSTDTDRGTGGFGSTGR